MSTEPIFKGIIPPVSTVFDGEGKLDREGTGKVIDFLLDSNVDGLFFMGTGGEFSQMSLALRKETAEFVTEYVNGRLPVLIGTGSTSTEEVIELTKHAKASGADGVVVINPFYWPLSEENLFQHYADIAEASELPILLYNFPNLTGQDLSPEFVKRLAEKYTNIVGIKETVDTAGHIREMILKVKAVRPDFSVFAGFDDHLFNTLALGGDGAISASANFAPELTVGIYHAFRAGDFTKAIELHRQLAPVPMMYKLDSPFVNVVKEAIRLRGLDISNYVLPPARALTAEKLDELKAILKQANLL